MFVLALRKKYCFIFKKAYFISFIGVLKTEKSYVTDICIVLEITTKKNQYSLFILPSRDGTVILRKHVFPVVMFNKWSWHCCTTFSEVWYPKNETVF